MLFEFGSKSSFKNYINKAIRSLQTKDYTTAQEQIKHAILENYNAPEVHNLLGILAELTGDASMACKHYRAAYALDPTYKPVSRNLERITSMYSRIGNENPDFGDKP
ncbi:MAG TPA: hypothetical protein VIK26_09640 [Clostridium sp.]